MPRASRSTSVSASSFVAYFHMRRPPTAGPSVVSWTAIVAHHPLDGSSARRTFSYPGAESSAISMDPIPIWPISMRYGRPDRSQCRARRGTRRTLSGPPNRCKERAVGAASQNASASGEGVTGPTIPLLLQEHERLLADERSLLDRIVALARAVDDRGQDHEVAQTLRRHLDERFL